MNFLSKDFNNYCNSFKSSLSTTLDVKEREYCIFVSIYEQKLYILKNNCVVGSFNISTSSAPESCIENSFGTPLGLHCIADKIGDGLDIDTVFVGRKPVGKISDFPKETQNMITTRIMRLRGLEEGKNLGGNCDTYNRYVYIHGTNKASEIGTRFSKGCIVLSPKDMLKLYDLIPESSLVYIDKSPFVQ